MGNEWRNRKGNEASLRISFNLLGVISFRPFLWTELGNILQNVEFVLTPPIEIQHHLLLPIPYLIFSSLIEKPVPQNIAVFIHLHIYYIQ